MRAIVITIYIILWLGNIGAMILNPKTLKLEFHWCPFIIVIFMVIMAFITNWKFYPKGFRWHKNRQL